MPRRRLLAIATLVGGVVGAAAVVSAPAKLTAEVRVVHRSTSIVSTPDGDLFAEAGERVGVAVEIHNVGTAPATGITATLAPTTVRYPDLAPGAVATNATPFVVALPRTFACGDGYGRAMTVSTQQGSFVMHAVTPVSAVGRPESWTSTTPVDIADFSTVESPLTLGAGPMSTILDLNVRINDLSHTWVGDLVILVLRPDGGGIVLSAYRGLGANFTNTVFDDEASTSLSGGNAPFTGTFRPDSDVSTLSLFDGNDATGTWMLRVRDDDATDTGRLNSWSIDAVTARCNEEPTASFRVSPLSPIVGKPATFTASAADSDGRIASQAWDLDNDGEFDDGTRTTARRTFSKVTLATIRFRAVDDLGNAEVVSRRVVTVRVCRVPRVVGRSLARAARAITRAGCRVGRVRRARSRRVGRVIRQSPRGGLQKPFGTRVNLIVGRR